MRCRLSWAAVAFLGRHDMMDRPVLSNTPFLRPAERAARLQQSGGCMARHRRCVCERRAYSRPGVPSHKCFLSSVAGWAPTVVRYKTLTVGSIRALAAHRAACTEAADR